MHVHEPRGGPRAHGAGRWPGTTPKGAPSLSPEHSDKATSPPRWAELSFVGSWDQLHPGPWGPSWSWGPMHHPTFWGAVELSTDRPAAPRSASQPPSPWKKALSASSVSQGRDVWPPAVPAVPSAKETGRSGLCSGGAAPPKPPRPQRPLFLKPWEPAEPLTPTGARKGLVWEGICMGEKNMI